MNREASALSPWIVRPVIRPESRFRLFCFPRAGAGVASFRHWAEEMHPEIEVVLLQPPGRESRFREKPFSTMPEMAQSVVDAMSGLLDKEYLFFGHSLGGKVAFETARELRRRNLPVPLHLFVAASQAPNVPWRYPHVHELDNRTLLHEIDKQYGGVPKEIFDHEELWEILLPCLRADMTVVETYLYSEEQPLSIPITGFCGVSDRMVTKSDMEEWKILTHLNFRLHMLPGDHFFPAKLRHLILENITQPMGLS